MSIFFNPEDKSFYDSEINNVKITESFIEITGGKEQYYEYLKIISEGNIIDVNELGEIIFIPETIESPPVNNDIIARNFIDFMKSSILDSIANFYGYDSIDNAISYCNSGITSWRNEAIAFNTWRDNTVSLMYQNIFSFTADGITLPDLDGFIGQTGYFDVGITSPSRLAKES
jgi:hypothetical protein